MSTFIRAAATVAASVGLLACVAPVASATSAAGPKARHDRPQIQVININFGPGSPLFANEFGPGDLSANMIEHSERVHVAAQNEAFRTGDIHHVVRGEGNHAPFEIEGSEQDQNER